MLKLGPEAQGDDVQSWAGLRQPPWASSGSPAIPTAPTHPDPRAGTSMHRGPSALRQRLQQQTPS